MRTIQPTRDPHSRATGDPHNLRRLRGRAGLVAVLLVVTLGADALLFKGQIRGELQGGAALREPIHPDLIMRQARDAAERMVRNSLQP